MRSDEVRVTGVVTAKLTDFWPATRRPKTKMDLLFSGRWNRRMRWVPHRPWRQSTEIIIIIIITTMMIRRCPRWSELPWVDRMPSVCIGSWRNTKSVKRQMMFVFASCAFAPSWTIRYVFDICTWSDRNMSLLRSPVHAETDSIEKGDGGVEREILLF